MGVNKGDLRHPIRILRQRVSVGKAKLTLYDYSPYWPNPTGRIVRQVETDENGRFDFGTLPTGHYTLVISSGSGVDRFDVEVKPLQKPTESVTIDISPVYPDCTGGHEFISVSE